MVIGSAPGEDMSKIEPSSYEFLADRILDRSHAFMPATAVLRGEANEPITPELIDTLNELLGAEVGDQAHDLPDEADLADTIADIIREEEEDLYAEMVETMVPPWAHSADMSDRARAGYSKFEFDKAEEALAEQNAAKVLAETQSSDPMRLTIHTLALSMALYVPPLGAALFAYTMLRDIFPMAAQAI
ncbi:MAG: hypothetical protein AAF280_09695 [Pseudomonadota bacterium]